MKRRKAVITLVAVALLAAAPVAGAAQRTVLAEMFGASW
jgi:hypothetical protein